MIRFEGSILRSKNSLSPFCSSLFNNCYPEDIGHKISGYCVIIIVQYSLLAQKDLVEYRGFLFKRTTSLRFYRSRCAKKLLINATQVNLNPSVYILWRANQSEDRDAHTVRLFRTKGCFYYRPTETASSQPSGHFVGLYNDRIIISTHTSWRRHANRLNTHDLLGLV